MPISIHLIPSALERRQVFLHYQQEQHTKYRLPSWAQFHRWPEEWQRCWQWLLLQQGPAMPVLRQSCQILTVQASGGVLHPPAKINNTPANSLIWAAIHGSLWAYTANRTGWFFRSSMEAWNRVDTRTTTIPAMNATDPIRGMGRPNSRMLGCTLQLGKLTFE